MPDKRIRTVLYQDQRFTPAELEILHTPALQRLYDLHQLGFADRVFVDASHSRFHHVVGVLCHVDKLMNAIARNIGANPREFEFGPRGSTMRVDTVAFAGTVQAALPICRLIGLLHDLTHAPFGHTVEDEIQVVGSKHDDPARQSQAFYHLLCQLAVWLARDAGWSESAEPLEGLVIPVDIAGYADGEVAGPPEPAPVGRFAARVLRETPETVRATAWRTDTESLNVLLIHLHVAMTALLHLEILHASEVDATTLPASTYPFQVAIETCLAQLGRLEHLEASRFNPHRDAYLLDVVGNTVCADLLDYAQRDAHFTGLRLDYDEDRIAENFTVVPFEVATYDRENRERGGGAKTVPAGLSDPFAGRCVRAAISLFSHKFRSDVPGELMNLLNARFYLYERAIYHPTKCAAGAMLGTALQLLGWQRSPTNPDPLPAELRLVGDAVFLHAVMEAARAFLTVVRVHPVAEIGGTIDAPPIVQGLWTTHTGRPRGAVVGDVVGAVRLLRRLQARRFYRQVYRALPNSEHAGLQATPETLAEVLRDAGRRFQVERAIESAARLPTGTVVIHCPKRTTATKVANVLLVSSETVENTTVDRIFKLRDIERFGTDLFGQHGEAVRAVTAMYKSMWRLGVYVSPEHHGDFSHLAEIAGMAIADAVAKHNGVAGEVSPWPNDPQLELELRRKLGFPRKRETARISVESLGSLRASKILQSARPFLQRNPPSKEVERFEGTFAASLATISDNVFNEIDAEIARQAKNTEFANSPSVPARGAKLDKVMSRLRELLRKNGIGVKYE